MIIGVPGEIKNNEYRVGLLPVHCEALVESGHTVLVERHAGDGSGLNIVRGRVTYADLATQYRKPLAPLAEVL
jgi:NAD/NADP transhydrogenase alpha subunit